MMKNFLQYYLPGNTILWIIALVCAAPAMFFVLVAFVAAIEAFPIMSGIAWAPGMWIGLNRGIDNMKRK